MAELHMIFVQFFIFFKKTIKVSIRQVNLIFSLTEEPFMRSQCFTVIPEQIKTCF